MRTTILDCFHSNKGASESGNAATQIALGGRQAAPVGLGVGRRCSSSDPSSIGNVTPIQAQE